MQFLEFFFVYILGALGYGAVELLWRGRTHWTMLLLGGVCLYLIYVISTKMKMCLWKTLCCCAAVITALEFSVGCLVNLRLGWNVWDYSAMPFDLMGQICPAFSAAWLLLSLPCVWLSRLMHRFVFAPGEAGKCKSS